MATFFVNARWTAADSGHPSSITWGTNNNYDVEWYDFDRGLNGEVTYSSGGAYCTSDLQAAINFAHENDTIVFYNVGGGEDIEDFKFYAQDTISVDKSLSFRTGSLSDTSKQSYTAKTVKFDALKIVPGSGLSGVTLSLGQGLYSTDDILDVNGTLELLNGAVFSADLVQNDADNGVIVVDTVSRFVADSIEDGMIEIKSGYVDNEKLKWIDRPVMARVGNGVKVRFISPDGDVLLGEQGTGTYKMVHVAKKKTAATPGAAAIYYYTDDDSGNPQTPSAVSAAPDDYTVYNYHVVTDNESLILVSDVFDLAGGSAPYTTAALYVDSTWTSGSTFEGQGQDKSTSPVAINSQYDGTTIVMNSIVAAMECPYVITTHTFDKVDQGVVIRIKEKPHDSESPEDWYIYDESSNSLSGNIRDIIIEPDKYLGADGKWHYDKVGIIFGNLPTSTPNMISFSHLESLEIGDWQFGTAGGRPGVLSFADIKHFTITTKLKTLGGSTTRIVNCPDVISETHFSVTGSTLIIENSNVTLNYGTSDGVLSTENNWLGSGSVIIRNSTFKVKSGSTAFYTVNLKKDAEFIITGDCTVDAMFSNLTGNDSDTHITFRDAVLGSDSNIRPLDSKPDMGADLHFEGNNTFDGATVTQAGGQDMLLDPGATLDLSNGASVTLPNYGDEISEITNNGLISLSSGSSITGGVITNAPDSSMTIDGTSHIQTDHFENSTGAVFTVALNADGTLPIQSLSEGVDVEIVNHGTMVLDAGGLNYTPNHIPIDSIGGDGNIILKVQGGGVEIMEDPVTGEKYIQMSQPDTSTLYVNMDWSTCSTGQNVGLFTYYGYNAFSDNGNPDNPQDSMWKAIRDEDNPTKRLVYTGVSGSVSYGDLDLSQSAAEHGVTIRTASSGSKVSANFGAMTAGTARLRTSIRSKSRRTDRYTSPPANPRSWSCPWRTTPNPATSRSKSLTTAPRRPRRSPSAFPRARPSSSFLPASSPWARATMSPLRTRASSPRNMSRTMIHASSPSTLRSSGKWNAMST